MEGETVNAETIDKSLIGKRVRVTRTVTALRPTRGALAIAGTATWNEIVVNVNEPWIDSHGRLNMGVCLIHGGWLAVGEWDDFCDNPATHFSTVVEILGS